MIKVHLRRISLLLLAIAIAFLGFFQVFMRLEGSFPASFAINLGVAVLLTIAFWAEIAVLLPYAAQTIQPCVVLLASLGVTMIARIGLSDTRYANAASRQILWYDIAVVLCAVLVAVLRDYRDLRRFSYVCMVVGIVLLLAPVVPGVGSGEIGGAQIWVRIGPFSMQPAEFAKLFLAVFFAAYLFEHRDQLAVGGREFLGTRLPRLKDLLPIAVVWLVSMGVLVLQRDLGTSLMFFAMFVSMLYVSTDRASWIVIGLGAFAVGAVLAASIFSHVQARVDVWLHPFDPELYGRAYGGSAQLVSGLFGLASGGLVGSGLGQGYPWITPLPQSDFIYSSLGEELGLTGLLAILTLYLVIIGAGMLTAMKIQDGFGKLLASGLVFTMAFQVFTVVGGITLVMPLTGLTLPFVAAGGSSLIANCVVATMLLIISNAAFKPRSDEEMSATFQMEALAALKARDERRRARKEREREQGEISEDTAEQPFAPGPFSSASRNASQSAPSMPPAPPAGNERGPHERRGRRTS